MTIKVLYTDISGADTTLMASRLVQKLPPVLRNEIEIYTSPETRLLKSCCRLQLSYALAGMGMPGRHSLSDMQDSPGGKPWFDGSWGFSFAHSGNLAICAVNPAGQVGIDVELLQVIDLNLYRPYFSDAEWSQITTSPDGTLAFYHSWVRKEAVAKACGKGVAMELSAIDISGDHLVVEQTSYYLKNIELIPGYVCYVASASVDFDITAEHIALSELEKISTT